MDVSRGASVERLRTGVGVGRRSTSLLGDGSFTAGGLDSSRGGGLLETFDAVFRSTVDSAQSASRVSASEERATAADGAERLESKRPESSQESRTDSADSPDKATQEGAADAVAVQEIAAEEVAGDAKVVEGREVDAGLKELTSESGIAVEEELEGQSEEELASVEAEAALLLAAVANPNVQGAIEHVSEDALLGSADTVVAGELADEEFRRSPFQDITERIEGLKPEAGAGEANEEIAAVEPDSDVGGNPLVASGKGEQQGNERGRRVGARYSDKHDGKQQVSDRPSHPMLEGGDFQAVVQGMPDELMREMRALELAESAALPTELQPAPVDSPQRPVVVEAATVLSSVAGAAAQATVSSGSSGAGDAGQADSFSSEGRVGGTESFGKRDDGLRGATGEGKAVQGGSNEAQVRLVQRVARAFQRLGPDGGRVNIMLHPAELGSVKLELQIDGQTMNARMTAESETAASVLRESLPELKQKLADAGMVVQSIDLQVADQQTGGSGGNGFQFGGGWDQAQQGRGQEGRSGRSGRAGRGDRGVEKGLERVTDRSVAQLGNMGRSLNRGSLDLRL